MYDVINYSNLCPLLYSSSSTFRD